MSVLILTYHAIEAGPPPLHVPPDLFREHVDAIAESGQPLFTVSQVAEALREDRLPERGIAVTFDDGAASVVRNAAPLLVDRGIPATVFCVAGHLGRMSDWPSQRPRTPQFELAGAMEIAELASAGFEIGSHGLEHASLGEATDSVLRRELVESKDVLEQAAAVSVRAFAYPYGVVPPEDALVRSTYTCACATGFQPAGGNADLYALPRVDVHYIRSPDAYRSTLAGGQRRYLAARRIASNVRRAVTPDHVR